MPYKVVVDTTKADALLRKLKANMAKAPLDGGKAAVNAVISGAKSSVPVRTGNLRNSIQSGPITNTSAEVTAGAEYAGFVEYGTSRMQAQPYMTPQIDRALKAYVTAALNSIKAL